MTSLTRVHLEFEAVFPHDLAALLQGQVLEALIQEVVAGRLPAKFEATLADSDAVLGQVHPAVRQMYLDRLANDVARLAVARSQFEELDLDEDGRLSDDFLVWPKGTAYADVRAWFA
jgi:hypothetical protein